MMYGPPPEYPRAEYPRATSSPPIIVLVAGLAALLGFLLGVFVGAGSSETSSSSEEPDARVTVTVEDSPPVDPETTASTGASPPQTGQSVPDQTLPGQTLPEQTQPSQTLPGQPQPGQAQPGSTGAPSAATSSGPGANSAVNPTVNPASVRTLIVGKDIQPGTYRTTGPITGSTMCYWARLRSATGDIAATGMPKGPASVTIEATDKAFVSGGCAEWIKA
ncbi:hypothetical protein [Nonomuraea sp. NPDC050786]|uniref:hypothetical protein n=1 Tax=Nonomuraea sp. NPDC050786 TaxID=3154840 RepID=UPI00340C1E9A